MTSPISRYPELMRSYLSPNHLAKSRSNTVLMEVAAPDSAVTKSACHTKKKCDDNKAKNVKVEKAHDRVHNFARNGSCHNRLVQQHVGAVICRSCTLTVLASTCKRNTLIPQVADPLQPPINITISRIDVAKPPHAEKLALT